MKRGALLDTRADPNRLVRQRCGHGSKHFLVLVRRVQRRHVCERLRNQIPLFRAHRVKHFRACHPIEIRAPNCFSVAGHFYVDRRDADHRHHDAFRCWQVHAETERRGLQHERAGFIPRHQMRFLLRVIIEKQTEEQDLKIRARVCETNSEYGAGRDAGLHFRRNNRDRLHPVGRRLRLRIRHWRLAQIEPRTFHISARAVARDFLEAIDENFLRVNRRDRDEGDKKRDNAR